MTDEKYSPACVMCEWDGPGVEQFTARPGEGQHDGATFCRVCCNLLAEGSMHYARNPSTAHIIQAVAITGNMILKRLDDIQESLDAPTPSMRES